MNTFALLALDLDGTFLTSEKLVSERNKKALIKVLETGAKVAICTGRTVPFTKPIADCLGVDVFLVANEGTHVSYSRHTRPPQIVQESTVSPSVTEAILALLRATNRVTFWYDGSSVHVVVKNEVQQQRLDKFLKRNHRRLDAYEVWETQEEFESGVLSGKPTLQKIMVLLDGEEDQALFQAETLRALQQNESATSANIIVASSALNVLPVGIDKGVGLMTLCEHLQIPMERVIAFGDEANDISFLSVAGVGVAMQNAITSVKEKASYTIPFNNDQDGVAQELERLLGANRFGPIA